ncbi:MAG: hypothetical protein LUC41_04700 [Clostridiales bacterium]|nr:hypothetical protein [Clostridiales bacterium]
MMMTSAYANKLLRQLANDKDYLNTLENSACHYTVAVGETPEIPEYDFGNVNAAIADIDEKTRKIRHAINVSNVSSLVTVGDREMTVDAILVSMSQISRRLNRLGNMRDHLPRERVEYSYSRIARNIPEYEYNNYDVEAVKAEYDRLSGELMEMQIALDRHNQTCEFEVDI